MNKANKVTQCNTYLDSLPKSKTTATECKVVSKTTSTQTNRGQFEVKTSSVAVLEKLNAKILQSQEKSGIVEKRLKAIVQTKSRSTQTTKLKTSSESSFIFKLTEIITNNDNYNHIDIQTIEIIEQQEEIDEDIKEVDRYELEIQIAITKIEKYSQRNSTVLSSFVEHENNDDPTTKEVSNRLNEEGIDIIMDNTRLNTLFKIIGVIAFILRLVAQCEIPKSQRKPD
ncbi:unnamed protein product [Mytilus coruscus]|uniref:Uncharacterized protein n=1 Tax=Mytilus coruscus TaxID=42192 RepID=A0A6J8AHM7_MYTCO|nr:unnamed protein product [Mytilus coruscus]